MKTAVYRHFGAAGELLYVGVSNDALRRLCQHKDRSHWFEQIARVDVCWLDTRHSALAAEATAIANESPRWNVQRPRARAPLDEQRRLAAVRHLRSGRLDGWYSGRGVAEHMVGWFAAMFPRDQFELVDTAAYRHGHRLAIHDGNVLKCLRWQEWAKTPPDCAAGDAFDRAADEVAA